MAAGPTPASPASLASPASPASPPTRTAALAVDDLHHYAWLHVPMWVFDADRMRIDWANPAGLNFWRASSLDALRLRDLSDATPATLQRLRLAMQRHAAGQVLRESWTVYPLSQPLTTTLVSRGITLADGRQAILFCSEPLAASYDADMLRGIEALQHTPSRVLMFRLDTGQSVMRNPAAVSTFGAADTRPTVDGFADLFADLSLGLALREAISGGAGHAGEALLRTLQGERWHAIDARAVHDPVSGLAMLLINARDISELKAALLALEAARDAAEAANRAKSSFLANMSHEIRTPMNGVLGLTELVLASALDDRQRRFLGLAHQSAQSLMQIINDILDVSKIEADRMTLELAPMSLRESLDLALAPLQVQAVQRGLVLDVALAPDLPPAVVTDATRWRQVLLNLVGNAVKFTASGRIDVALACRPAELGGWQLDCTVSDTGIGMTADELSRVFAPFTQADASITRRYGGTGLGLTIVHRVVQLLGGRIDASSSPGAGSSFRVVVPVTLPEAR